MTVRRLRAGGYLNQMIRIRHIPGIPRRWRTNRTANIHHLIDYSHLHLRLEVLHILPLLVQFLLRMVFVPSKSMTSGGFGALSLDLPWNWKVIYCIIRSNDSGFAISVSFLHPSTFNLTVSLHRITK